MAFKITGNSADSCGSLKLGNMAARSWIRGKLIGAGAFGKVNLAMNREDGEVFAVKSVEVNQSDAGAKVSLEALENEIELLQSLDSKFVVRCLGNDWTEESGKLMRNVFLEYMPEGSLSDFLKQFASAEVLDENLLRTYTRSVVEGLDYLHRNGIVHCDIKGKNILVGNGSVKLTDFGSAKRVGDVMETEWDVVNCSAKVNGTPLWMAPEVVRQVEQGPASDIWSLGCTVVETATGQAPWSNLTNPFVALYHIGCTDELPAVPASLSAEAHDFLSKCFQRDPRKRWTSAQLLQHSFLTTRFLAVSQITSRAPLSPASVMQFPASASSSLQNSVPILTTPSFFERGLVRGEPRVRSPQGVQEQVEGDWWGASPFSPCAGEWIVVRSPKGSSPASSSPISDWMAPAFKSSVSTAEFPIVSHEVEDYVTSRVIAEQEITTVSLTPERHSCTNTDGISWSRNASSSSVGASPTTSRASADAERLGLEPEIESHVSSLEICELEDFVMLEEQGIPLDLAGSSIANEKFLAFAMDEEAPRACHHIETLDEVQTNFEVSDLVNCSHLNLKQLIGAEHHQRVQSTRIPPPWSVVDHLDWRIAPSEHCTSHLHNPQSPWVKLRNNVSCQLCVFFE